MSKRRIRFSDTETNFFVFYIASPTPRTAIGLDTENLVFEVYLIIKEIYCLLQSCELCQTKRRGSLLPLPARGHMESPSSDLSGQTRTAGRSQMGSHCRSVASFCLVSWRSCQGKHIVFWHSLFLSWTRFRFFIAKNKKIFPSNKSNDDSKEECLQKWHVWPSANR